MSHRHLKSRRERGDGEDQNLRLNKKRNETEVGMWQGRWRSSVRRMRSREEADMREEGIEIVWRGKRQSRDLLMQN